MNAVNDSRAQILHDAAKPVSSIENKKYRNLPIVSDKLVDGVEKGEALALTANAAAYRELASKSLVQSVEFVANSPEQEEAIYAKLTLARAGKVSTPFGTELGIITGGHGGPAGGAFNTAISALEQASRIALAPPAQEIPGADLPGNVLG